MELPPPMACDPLKFSVKHEWVKVLLHGMKN